MVIGPNGHIVEELALFLRNRFVLQNATLGTLHDEAYILVDWWSFLDLRQCEWGAVDQSMVLGWVRLMEPHMEKARITRKLSVMTRFQKCLFQQWRPDELPTSIFGGDSAVVSYPASQLRTKKGRYTPDMHEAEAIMSELSDEEDPYLASRNWLIGMWMLHSGLRAQGVSQLSLRAISRSLVAEKCLPADAICLSRLNRFDARSNVLSRLQVLEDVGREHLFIPVVEKGTKSREVAAPFSLVIETLEFVWSERAGFVKRRGRSEDVVFLSKKTAGKIEPGSIGDIVKAAFKKCQIDGSGHRLRALYACRLVRKRYERAVEAHGRLWEPVQVLMEAAELLGHDDPETLRTYLDRALREDHWSF